MCVSGSDHTVAIVLSIFFGVIVCLIAALLLFYYVYKVHKDEKTPEPEAKLEKREYSEEGNKPVSEPTVMAFVLPEFPESKRESVMKQ